MSLTSLCGLCDAQQQASEAGGYPQRPIRMIVPYPPGGGADILARMIGQRLGGNLKQQVVIDNRPGGGGNMAAEIASRSNPDGYTLILSLSGLVTTAVVNRHTNYDPVHGFTPILLVARSPYRVVINPALPARTIQEWCALVKAEPGRFNYGTAGTGTAVHLSVELFKLMTKLDMLHVPYKGTGPAMTDLIGGRIQMMFGGTLSSIPHEKAGRIRVLAVTSLQRRADSPEVPTLTETVAPGYEAVEWFGILAPVGLPKPLLAKIHAESARAITEPDMKARLLADGMDVVAGSPEEFAMLIQHDFAKWKRVVKETRIAAE